MSSQPLILASSSKYRCELLARLTVDFSCHAADIDEHPVENESPECLVRRLAEQKARIVAGQMLPTGAAGLVIGSDQVAVMDSEIIGKSGNEINAINQLRRSSGNRITFLTGLCLLNNETASCQVSTVPSHVHFRVLSDRTIRDYLRREPAFDCAGSFKSEGLGISLLESIDSKDPTALIGLPLIALSQMLLKEGFDVLAAG